MRKDSFFNFLAVLLVAVAVLQISGLFYFDIDEQVWWWDKLLHFLGGLWIGGITLWFLAADKANRHRIFSAILISSGGAFVIGFFWELYEAAMLRSFNLVFPIDYASDTITDLLADSVGGFIAAFLFLRLHRTSVERRGLSV